MSRPIQVFASDPQNLVVFAGTNAHAIVKHHPSVDGSKRVAFVIARVFLGMNDLRFDPPEPETVVMVDGLASSRLTKVDFVRWIRKHSR